MEELPDFTPTKIDAFWVAQYASDSDLETGLNPSYALQADFDVATGKLNFPNLFWNFYYNRLRLDSMIMLMYFFYSISILKRNQLLSIAYAFDIHF